MDTSQDADQLAIQVYQKFIENLSAANMPSAMVERLKKVLLEDKKYTEQVLKDALLKEDAAL